MEALVTKMAVMVTLPSFWLQADNGDAFSQYGDAFQSIW